MKVIWAILLSAALLLAVYFICDVTGFALFVLQLASSNQWRRLALLALTLVSLAIAFAVMIYVWRVAVKKLWQSYDERR